MRRLLVPLLALALSTTLVTPASAAAFPTTVPLPNDFAPEGIAIGPGTTFYVGSLTTGDIYRGDLRTGRGRVFVDAPAGRAALGLKVDRRHHLLFVAGGTTGAAFVYNTRTGATVAALQLAPTGATSLVNDVVVTRTTAWFTDSFRPVLYAVPISPRGRLGTPRTVALSGPASVIVPGFNLNGIDATPNGRTLVVNNSALGALFTVNPRTGASAQIAVSGLVPGTPDGLLLRGKSLWVVENVANMLVRVTLNSTFTAGRITRTITSPLFHVPTTVARHGSRLAVVNSHFDLGLPPPFGPGAPPGTAYEVLVLR